MKNLAGLMKQASAMQDKMKRMQAELEATSIEGLSGAGLVRVTLGGKGDLRAVAIDPKLLDPGEGETLSDLLLAAHADAKRRLDERTAAAMAEVSGGLDLPPGFKLPF